MKDYSYVYNAHPSFIEKMYNDYHQNPDNVDSGWRTFFEGFEFAGSAQQDNASGGEYLMVGIVKEFGVLSLIFGFRTRGHLLSDTNPIRKRKDRKPHLNLHDHDLEESDMDQVFQAGKEIGLENGTLRQIVNKLYKLYGGSIGVEYAHIENREKRSWLKSKIESMNTNGDYGLSIQKKKRILDKLNGAVMFEKFLHTKYVGQKRFSLEGGKPQLQP